MASPQPLTILLENLRMPNQEWWDTVEIAYHDMCHMLTEDINTEGLSNHASRPMIVILPTGNYACRLSSRNEVLTCVAFGTIRVDLFVEVLWQNISRAQEKGSIIKAYKVSERGSLISFSGHVFSLNYVESSELVRQYPAIVDVPRAVQAKLQDGADESIEAIRDLKLLADHTKKYPVFHHIYYVLRAWMIGNGLYVIDDGGQSLRLSKRHMACFDGELLRELSWAILLNNKNEASAGHVSAMFTDYLLHHKDCIISATKSSCIFYDDSKGPFARHWSDNQFRIVHEEFRTLCANLTGDLSRNPSESFTSDDRLENTLWHLISRPLVEKLSYQSFIRTTIQYSGQSQITGTKMMEFVEDRMLDLIETLESSLESVHLRPWPTRLVEVHAEQNDHPYEGYWLLGISHDGSTNLPAIERVLNTWNDQICASHRYTAATMVIHAEHVNRSTIAHQQLKEDPRKWPLPLAKPDPRYTPVNATQEGQISDTTVATTTLPNPLQSPRKLRPALDVLSRLKHDPTFDLDDYVVGYTDRHAGIQEKAAGAWVSESTDEEWIPQGRIQYFWRVSDGKRVWDRGTKYDCVFR